MQINRLPAAAVAVATLALSLTGCAGGLAPGTISLAGNAGPAGGPSPTSSSDPYGTPSATSSSHPTGTPTPSGSTFPTGTPTPTGRSDGCPAGGASIPRGAGQAPTADLDGDGLPDIIWLADLGTRRTLGVRTASGAGFTTTFTSAAPQAANAVAGRVVGSSVVLLDTGRSVLLYSVINCRLVATANSTGGQYTFDKGFSGYGTGVGCPVIGSSGPHLAGYLATGGGTKNTWTVTRTTVLFSGEGRSASNGTTVTLGRNLPENSPVVTTARQVTCGDSSRAQEPQ